eukprot:SAG22_NODE_5493_length_1004_cov_1.630939_2_plen_83_part_01
MQYPPDGRDKRDETSLMQWDSRMRTGVPPCDQQPPEGPPVHRPAAAGRGGSDRCGARRGVHQRELTERLPRLEGSDRSLADSH